MRLLEIFRRGFREDGRCKRAKDFAVLDAAVESVLHLRTPRVGDDAAISKRPRPPFGAALKPAEDFSSGDGRGAAARQFFFGKFGDAITILRKAARIDRAADFFSRIRWSPVGVIHHKRARLAQFLVPYIKRGAHRETRVPRRWMNVDLLEWSRI